MKRLAWVSLAAALTLLASALAPTTVTTPKNLTDARQVFLIDHGTHSSIAIETAAGDMVRYAYGDLRYYANRDTSLASGAAAVLIATPATLGRAELEGPAHTDNLRRQLVVLVDTIYPLEVEAAQADRLMGKLDQLHQAGAAEHISVPAYGLIFAPHPDDYIWYRNSSSVIAGWLEEMDVAVFGWRLLANWRLAAS
jgi:hypothetical protein